MNEFKYNENKLSFCASSYALHHNGDNQDCRDLFQQHQTHFERDYANESLTLQQNKYNEFLKNVEFVHEHNSQLNKHRVSLNQFSDMLEDDFPFHAETTISRLSTNERTQVRDTNYSHSKIYKKIRRRHKSRKRRVEEKRRVVNHGQFQGSFHPISHKGKKGPLRYFLSDSYPSHLNTTNEFKVDPKQESWTSHLNWASGDNPDGISLVHPSIDQGSCGSCWAFAATGTVEAIASRHVGFHVYDSIIDQLTDLGTNSAKHTNGTGEITDRRKKTAIQAAQQAELDALKILQLSAQELVDCDTKYDQGCIGGNPVMAFPFIYKHGLVSGLDYPYVGKQKSCHKKTLKGKRAIATAASWGVLESKNEENMKHVLRHLGPIAVGVNGNDRGFTQYKSGVFDSKKCGMRPNHAMLIVGYGEDETEGKYWIARNSWGTTWGMNGFIRVKRNSSKKISGVCGIARNPSIAMGAKLLRDEKFIKRWEIAHGFHVVVKEPVKTSKRPSFFKSHLSESFGSSSSAVRADEQYLDSDSWLDYATIVAPIAIIIVTVMLILERCRTNNSVVEENSTSEYYVPVSGQSESQTERAVILDEKTSIGDFHSNMKAYGSATTA